MSGTVPRSTQSYDQLVQEFDRFQRFERRIQSDEPRERAVRLGLPVDVAPELAPNEGCV
jgi:hypothetical protein